MKIVAIIALMLISLTDLFGQREQINQLTKDGNKTGKWIEYGLNGKPASIKVYKAITRRVSEEELFLNSNKIPGQDNKSDSTLEQSISVGQWFTYTPDGIISEIVYYSDEGRWIMTDRYSYDGAGIPQVERLLRDRKSFVIGRTDSVEFSTLDFYEIKRSNEFFDISTRAKNLSGHRVTIQVIPLKTLEVPRSTHVLEPLDSIDIKVGLKFLPGHTNETIEFKSSEWNLDLEVKGFGYQLTTIDFDTEESKIVTKTFYYYRTGDEYQMEILREKGGTTLEYLPLSKQQIKIDLERGNYVLTIIGPFGRKSKKIKVE
jgi:hypothetical protein